MPDLRLRTSRFLWIAVLLLLALGPAAPAVPSQAGPSLPGAAASPAGAAAAPAGDIPMDTADVLASVDPGHGVYSVTAWVTTTVDSAGDVGMYTSLALDAAGRPHVSYYDATLYGLKYAYHDGSAWVSTTVEYGNVAGFTALALDAAGRPHVAYSTLSGALKYAVYSGTAWFSETVDTGGWIDYTALALDAAGRPHVAYSDVSFGELKYAVYSDSAWFLDTVDGGGVGQYPSLALDAAGRPHVSYYDFESVNLKYAYYDGTAWVSATVGAFGDGQFTSLALDAEGHPHISHFSSGDISLKYTYYDGITWTTETVDTDGYGTALALDAAGFPRIAYRCYDVQSDLKYAYKDGLGWHTWRVDHAGSQASYPSIALDGSGLVHISYYDSNDGDLRYAVGHAPLSGVAIVGPPYLLVEQPGLYSAVAQSRTVDLPVTYTWNNGTVGPSATYAWPLPGVYAVAVTASNGLEVVTASHDVGVGVAVPIDPGMGGMLYYTDVHGLPTSFAVPPGAVTQTVLLAVYPLLSPTQPPPPGLSFAHHAFVLEVLVPHRVFLPVVLRAEAGAAAGGRGTGPAGPRAAPGPPAQPAVEPLGFSFAAPITVTLRYSDGDVAGLDENTLRLLYWTGSAWEDVAATCTPPSVYLRNPLLNVLGVELCHLTEFELVGQ